VGFVYRCAGKDGKKKREGEREREKKKERKKAVWCARTAGLSGERTRAKELLWSPRNN